MQNIEAIIFDWGRTIYDKDNEQLFSETEAVLEYCSRKYTLCIVSLAIDGDIELRFQRIDDFKIRKYFKFALFNISDKDSLFRIAIGNLGIKADKILVVDDRIKRLTWPIQNGCRTCWIQKGKFANELPFQDLDKSIKRANKIFPSLNCGLTILYLRHILKTGNVVNGKFNKFRHTFLVIGKNIVDITSDQCGGTKTYVGPLVFPYSID
jgi:FMN phosphatase YigB (HAD superfamily)